MYAKLAFVYIQRNEADNVKEIIRELQPLVKKTGSPSSTVCELKPGQAHQNNVNSYPKESIDR